MPYRRRKLLHKLKLAQYCIGACVWLTISLIFLTHVAAYQRHIPLLNSNDSGIIAGQTVDDLTQNMEIETLGKQHKDDAERIAALEKLNAEKDKVINTLDTRIVGLEKTWTIIGYIVTGGMPAIVLLQFILWNGNRRRQTDNDDREKEKAG